MAVRGVLPGGTPDESTSTFTVPGFIAPREVSPRQRSLIPLEDGLARQSLILRLADLDTRLVVWHQPLDDGWYFTFEIPQQAPYITGRRLVTDGALLDSAVQAIAGGNIYCRRLGVLSGADPVGGAGVWGATHVLAFETET